MTPMTTRQKRKYSKLRELEIAVIEFIRSHLDGRATALTAEEIARAASIPLDVVNSAILGLADCDILPLGYSAKGYYRIMDDEDRSETIRYLNEQIVRLTRVRNNLI